MTDSQYINNYAKELVKMIREAKTQEEAEEKLRFVFQQQNNNNNN